MPWIFARNTLKTMEITMNREACPFCGAGELQHGEIRASRSSNAYFVPTLPHTKRFVPTMKLLLAEVSREATMCLECGNVWASADPVELKKRIRQHSGKPRDPT